MYKNVVNTKVLNLWKTINSNLPNDRMPLLYKEKLKTSCLLYIGINPSFSKDGKKFFKEKSIDMDEFFEYPLKKYDYEIDICIQKEAEKTQAYFKKANQLAEELNLDLEYMDLFFIRETDQNQLKSKIYLKKKLNTFALEQLKLSKELLLQASPKIILVANALASNIFKEEFSNDITISNNCYYLSLNNKKIPLFFSGMLSGQRALDNFSFERLKWNMQVSI